MSPALRHLPNLERHLRWLIAFRLVMISSVLLSYLVFELSSRGELPEFNLLFVLVAATYVASILHIALLRLLATRPLWHAYIQFAGDLALVSGLVYFFGGITSPFSMLYLVVIMVAAVILQRRVPWLRRSPVRVGSPRSPSRPATSSRPWWPRRWTR